MVKLSKLSDLEAVRKIKGLEKVSPELEANRKTKRQGSSEW